MNQVSPTSTQAGHSLVCHPGPHEAVDVLNVATPLGVHGFTAWVADRRPLEDVEGALANGAPDAVSRGPASDWRGSPASSTGAVHPRCSASSSADASRGTSSADLEHAEATTRPSTSRAAERMVTYTHCLLHRCHVRQNSGWRGGCRVPLRQAATGDHAPSAGAQRARCSVRHTATLVRSVAVVALAVPVGLLFSAASAGASCVAPTIDLSSAGGAASSAFTISGAGFMAECRDVIMCEVDGPCEEPEPSPPIETVEVFFEQDGSSEVIATAHPSASYSFVVTASIPEAAVPGDATITAVGSTGVRTTPVPFTVSHGAPPTTDDGQILPDTGPGPLPTVVLACLLVLGAGMSALARRVAPAHAITPGP